MESLIFSPNHSFSFIRNNKKMLSVKIQQLQHLTGMQIIQLQRKPIFNALKSLVATEDDSPAQTVEVDNKIKDLISCTKSLLSTIEDGRISVSPYDTAWVALIRNIDGIEIPQFPSSLEWVAQHQHLDGSWGDEQLVNVYDRLVNTIACVIALKTWNVHDDKIDKGISYVKEHVAELGDAFDVHMTCGFEVIYHTLLQKAHDLGIEEIPISEKISTARDHKMKKIPRELMHQVTTTLLYSLEGLQELDWPRLLKLQSPDGSFFTSPSSTAFAFMETKDHKCLKFITDIVHKFNGGAPTTYPVDLYARLWATDRLQRLGISRFFQTEIKDCLTYVYRFWNDNGIYSRRDINYSDVDDTSMAFRLLRLHGYDVNPNVLRKFKEGDRFICQRGEVTPSTTAMYALYRASQIRFEGDVVLEEAYDFSRKFLHDWLEGDEHLDKWVISKNLPHEVGLEMPWYATLPRVEVAYYLQHYGGSANVWFAKTLYRMPDIQNDEYLELARLDFERCQSQHLIEWSHMQGWYENQHFEEFGISRKQLLVAYFLAAATIFEPEKGKERILWAKSQLISKMIRTIFDQEHSREKRSALLKDFSYNINCSRKLNSAETEHRVVNIMLESLHDLFKGFDECISLQLKSAWYLWVMKFEKGHLWEDAELFVTTLNICSLPINDVLLHREYITLSRLVNKICHHLSQIPNKKEEVEMRMAKGDMSEIEEDLEALTKLVLVESSFLTKNIKQTFLWVAKTFYYVAYFDAATIHLHIYKVLFERIV
ncbi:peregrinol diphosphate synthase TPS1, chloroplastic-like isoform X2 [Salvia hispanica]|uniref:peregrinol diphosphate synthase TPS1, chloroplastic-like isoform X2 n=1 Tax=Salvia hispanica TaxID=49212 RepID=UPI0020095B59|nr:peregrinol diphosphate synthase TPS1, chloroplastic-like isoform X2 [Salvia hispanica]